MEKKRKKLLSFILVMALIITSVAVPQGFNSKTAAAESNTFTLYLYNADTDVTGLYMNIWNHAGLEFGADATTSSDWGWANPQAVLQAVADHAGWYQIPVTVTDATANDGFDIYKNGSADSDKIVSYDNQWNSAADYAVLVSGTSESYAIKDSKVYTDLTEAGFDTAGAGGSSAEGTGSSAEDENKLTVEDLKTLKAEVPSDYQNMGFTAGSVTAVTDALAAANTLIEENSTDTDKIAVAHTALTTAIESLVFSSDLFVKKVANYDENSIRGMDVSSYLSMMNTFEKVKANMKEKGATDEEIAKVGFKDWNGNVLTKQGFFDLLKASGVNYIRLRVWNDPYDSNGNGYGGGNNDLAAAVEMGKYVTAAGMKTLIDFHLSDFWADPGKQKAPKAWENYTADEKANAVSQYIKVSLQTLKDAGVDVGMVQVGNETNGAVCGVKDWADMNKIFDAGCDAIHAFDENILAVIHFTNPEKAGFILGNAAKLAAYDGDGDGENEGVSYDVLATSYYPASHGTMANLTSVLKSVAEKYNKYVMVAETAWANINEDGDGFGDPQFKTGTDVDYNVTVQGQADEIRDVANAVNAVPTVLENGKKAALGFFYWEPAWIPVQSIVDETGKVKENKEEIIAENKALWEEFGSGWASSYAVEYEPDDAGMWYGGTSMDNQGVFDFNGNPLSSLNVYKYLKYGAQADKVIPDGYKAEEVNVEIGNTVNELLPKVSITYNDGTVLEKAVEWNSEDIEKINEAAKTTEGIGAYTVNGVVAENNNYKVSVTVNVVAKNLLADPGFENSPSAWVVTGDAAGVKSGQDKRNGEMCTHFYSSSDMTFEVSTDTKVTQAGYYNASIYMQGMSSAGSRDGESLKLVATTGDGKEYASDNVTLGGWGNWQKVTVNDIYVSNEMIKNGQNTITLAVKATLDKEAWGTFDDANLYLSKEEKQEESQPEEEKEHTWGEWVIDIYPTFGADGKRHRECSDCGMKQFEMISSAGTTDDYPALTKDTVVEKNAPDVIASSKKDVFVQNVLSDTEKTALADGTNVRLWFTVAPLSDDTVPAADKELIEAKTKEIVGSSVITYFDLDFWKKVGNDTKSQIHDAGTKISFILTIPENIRNKDTSKTRTYYILRVHDNKCEVIKEGVPNANYELNFESDKFSTYAIIYADRAAIIPGGYVPVVPMPVVTPTPTPTAAPTATPEVTAEPTAVPTEEPTATPEVTAEPTIAPTEEPTIAPSATPVNTEKDDEDADFGSLKLKAIKNKKHQTTLTWTGIKQADGYLLYGNMCNHDGKQYKVKYIGKVSKDTRSKVIKKMKKGLYYKFKVVAYKNVNGKKVVIAQSVMVHTITTGGKYGVAKAVKLTKIGTKKYNTTKTAKLSLAKGKSKKIVAKEVRADKNKPIRYHRDLCYESSNKKVAKVSKDGRITAVGKGSCKVYVYAQNGVYNTVKVTVK